MNYSAIYNRLIERAKSRILTVYCERHHVVPKCLGGSDDPGNIVLLTAEEHYLAHQILVKIYPKHSGLLWAAIAMTQGGRSNGRTGNKLYGWLRKEFVRQQTGSKRWSDEDKARIGLASKKRNQGKNHPMFGRKHSAETKQKMSEDRKGKPSGAKGIPKSDSTKEKLRAIQLALPAKGASGLKGVTWNNHAKKWQATMRMSGRRVFLGYFSCKYEAHAAWLAARERKSTHEVISGSV